MPLLVPSALLSGAGTSDRDEETVALPIPVTRKAQNRTGMRGPHWRGSHQSQGLGDQRQQGGNGASGSRTLVSHTCVFPVPGTFPGHSFITEKMKPGSWPGL